MENGNKIVVAERDTALYLAENCVYIPMSYYEKLVRAETELRILEAGIEADSSRWNIEDVLRAIKKARRELDPVTANEEKDDAE